MTNWVKSSERLPEPYQGVLIRRSHGSIDVSFYLEGDLWDGGEFIWKTENITHWMPLPEPPSEEE